MGQAKQRGTFEERKAESIKKQRKLKLNPTGRRNTSKRFSILSAMLAAFQVIGRKQ